MRGSEMIFNIPDKAQRTSLENSFKRLGWKTTTLGSYLGVYREQPLKRKDLKRTKIIPWV